MKKIIALCLALGLAVLAACGQSQAPSSESAASVSSAPEAASSQPETPPEEAPDVEYLANDGTLPTMMTLFTCQSVPLVVDAGTNACYSPASLYLALALAGSGATGQTEAEMADVLNLAGGFASLGEPMRELMDTLPFETEAGQLLLGNSVWLAQPNIFDPEFSANALENYDASLFTVPFGEAGTDEEINHWVLGKTNDLIDPGVQTDPDATMLLINTVYFKDEWVPVIEPDNNTNEPFFTADGAEPEAEYMHLSLEQEYYTGEGFTASSLAMKNGGSMTFVLPDEGVSPAELLAQPASVYQMLAKDGLEPAVVQFKIPKFTIRDSIDPASALESLGMPVAFTDDAEFTGLYEGAVPGKISGVSQDTYIAVDEKGAEAAGATVIEIAPTAAPPEDEIPPIIELYLERPFIFYLSMPQLGDAPLFIGVFSAPD